MSPIGFSALVEWFEMYGRELFWKFGVLETGVWACGAQTENAFGSIRSRSWRSLCTSSHARISVLRTVALVACFMFSLLTRVCLWFRCGTSILPAVVAWQGGGRVTKCLLQT